MPKVQPTVQQIHQAWPEMRSIPARVLRVCRKELVSFAGSPQANYTQRHKSLRIFDGAGYQGTASAPILFT
jgi:hypothetical protein